MAHREKHFIDGELAPSVTEVLAVIDKPFLKIWYGRLGLEKAQAYLKETQELGRNVHSAIEGYFRGEPTPELTQQEARMFSLFRQWALDTKFTPTELELHVESKHWKFHGTFDAVGHFGDGKLVICDWKTSSMIDDTYGAQLAAYATALREQHGIEVNDGLIVRVDKKLDAKKPLEVKRFENFPMYFSLFEHCLEVWKFGHKLGAYKR
jgi:hypothetical protein